MLQFKNQLVKIRKIIYKLIAQPIRVENVELSTRKFDFVDHNGQNQTAKLEGRITTRIEKYANKTRILVFTDVNSVFLKPLKKTIHIN